MKLGYFPNKKRAKEIKEKMVPKIFKMIKTADEISFSIEKKYFDTDDFWNGGWNEVKPDGRYRIIFDIYIEKDNRVFKSK